MKELDFILLYKINRKSKSIYEAKKKINLFWETLAETLQEDEQVNFRYLGKFLVKRNKPRRYSSPYSQQIGYTTGTCIVKFKVGESLRKNLNEVKNDE
ncbi:HU family DNA-binding protein [Fusobacterium sp.]|uniref:HU family DNA-binding protein n=1 Tax=Fusobacterium sp. TaxID=68766 RepID=UPI00262BB633|nr:HU family DNA-binding protein [Fusobacterium sp.]